ncbi:DUF4352 domain-containing protein [Streptomyces tsukubensis]|uniref:DUF4352 domain-containing protein n=1 Tax=Streptomyces tsukubensis TaxID=83656 RepID=UPI00344D36F8
MRAYVRRACVPAVLLGALLAVTGCSDEDKPKASEKPAPSAPASPAAEGPDESAPSPSADAGPVLSVGKTAAYDVIKTDDTGENPRAVTKMEMTVKGVKYVSADQIGADKAKGQYAVLTLTVKNVGSAEGEFAAYGKMKWEDSATAAQDATTLETTDAGQSLDTTYKPGQSVTGDVVLDVVRKGGTVTYYDSLSTPPAVSITLPKT